MEFVKKLDFTPDAADYAAEVPPQSKAAYVVPAIMLSMFIIIPAVMLGFILSSIKDSGPIMILPIVFVLLFIGIAVTMIGFMFRSMKRSRLPAVMIKGGTIAARYRNGWYLIHKAEIKSVSVTEIPGEPPQVTEATDDSRADVLVANINAGFVQTRGMNATSVVPSGTLSFIGNTVSFTVSTPSALGAARRIAGLIRGE